VTDPAPEDNHRIRCRWRLLDILKLEALVYRHQARIAEGARRPEDEANRRLARAIQEERPVAQTSRREFLWHWTRRKWDEAFGDELVDGLDAFHHQSAPLVGAAFLAGAFVNWLIGFAGSNAVDALAILVTHAFFPLASLVAFLILGTYWGDSISPLTALRRLSMRLSRDRAALRKSVHDEARRRQMDADQRAAASHGVLGGFAWLYGRVARWLAAHSAPAGVAAGDGRLTSRDALAQAIRRQNPEVRQWLAIQFQKVVIGYLIGFVGMLVLQLAGKSTAFYWSTTFSSVFDAARMQGILKAISLPWRSLAAPPTVEQVAATQRWPGADFPVDSLLQSAWEAWAWFLVFAIICYAIAPRLVLIILQSINLKRSLAAESFDQLRFDKLIAGMECSAGLQRQGPIEEEQPQPAGPPRPLRAPSPVAGQRTLVIADSDLMAGCGDQALAGKLGFSADDGVKTIILDDQAMSSEDFERRVEQSTREWAPLRSRDRVMHLVHASALPKSAYRTRVERTRHAIGEAAGIVFVLVDGEPASPEAPSDEAMLWMRAISKWDDPNLDVAEIRLNGSVR